MSVFRTPFMFWQKLHWKAEKVVTVAQSHIVFRIAQPAAAAWTRNSAYNESESSDSNVQGFSFFAMSFVGKKTLHTADQSQF